jgi:hypothetical protein
LWFDERPCIVFLLDFELVSQNFLVFRGVAPQPGKIEEQCESSFSRSKQREKP